MHPIKYFWALRAILYKPFFKHIGNMSYIGKPCFIEGSRNITIGKKTRIFPGIRLETIKNGEINIGENVAIEQNVHITSAGLSLNIGNNTTILGNTFITNIDHIYQDVSKSVLEQSINVKQTVIGEGCFIGFGVAIQAGSKLGNHCIVGAHSMVKGEFPDYCVIVGCPAKIVKVYNSEAQKWEKIERKD